VTLISSRTRQADPGGDPGRARIVNKALEAKVQGFLLHHE
jgi:hypothetical protein